MKSVKTQQLAIIAGIVILIVLLLFANTRLPEKEKVAPGSEHAGNSSEGTIEPLVENSRRMLPDEQKQRVKVLEDATATAADKKTAFEAIINLMDSLRQPILAAHFMEKAALASPTEKNWEDTGNRYYMATRFFGDAEKPALFKKAMEAFEKTLAINPGNTEVKINLAACYVESPDPMKGITMLKEIEKTDSNNVNLQLNFAFFSERSGQWDRAIARFKKVLKIQPDFIEAYLHLADAYERKGDKQAAIESLKSYMGLIDDVTIKAEVQNYINQLSQDSAPGEHKH